MFHLFPSRGRWRSPGKARRECNGQTTIAHPRLRSVLKRLDVRDVATDVSHANGILLVEMSGARIHRYGKWNDFELCVLPPDAAGLAFQE